MRIFIRLNCRLKRMRYGSYGEIFSFRFFEWLIIRIDGIVTGILHRIAAHYDWGRIV